MKQTAFRLGAFAAFITAALIFLAPDKSQAQDERWSVSASNWMQYWYHQASPIWFRANPADSLNPVDTLSARRDSLDNRFSVDFNLGSFYAGAWLRSYQPNISSDANEKITQRYFGWRQDGINVHVGNFYQTFDRGMTLNAFLDDAVYFDNNLDGIKVSGMFDHVEFDGLSARGFKFLQGQNEFTLQREYTIRAVRGAVKPLSGLKYGFSYVMFKQNSSQQYRQSNDVNLVSVNHEINKGPFSFYGEYARKDGYTAEDEKTDGDGTYLSGSYSHRLFSVYGEYKNIFRLLYPGPSGAFNMPPPVSHSGRNLSALASVPGERAYQVGTLLSPSFNLNFDLAFSESFSRGFPIRYYLAEKFAGVRWNPMEKIAFNAHWDRFDYSASDGDEIETYFDGYYYLGPTQTVSLMAYSRRFWPVGAKDYHEDYLTLGYSRGNFAEISVGGSISNRIYPEGAIADPKKMAFAEITFHYKTHELSIFHGSERGGIVCSSGICSFRPTFQGTRVILLSRL